MKKKLKSYKAVYVKRNIFKTINTCLDVYDIEYIQKHVNNCIPTFQKCIIPKNVSRTYAQLICENAFVNP